MTDRLFCGQLSASISDVIEAGVELLPHFELAAMPLLDAIERPGEEPAIRRRLRSEGLRARQHRGTLLFEPGDLDRLASSGMLSGADELFLMPEWNDEFEPFPGRVTPDVQDFSHGSPLGLEEWMVDSGCLLVLGDGVALNYATLGADLHERLRAQFKPAQR